MAKQEFECLAYTAGLTPDGWEISVTERAESSVTAYANLVATIAVMKEDGLLPFVTNYNKAQENITPAPTRDDPFPVTPVDEVPSVVAQAEELGGREIPAGHRYLGVKPGKVDDILENDSYDVVASTYTYDGTWVNFYNGNRQSAGYYYSNKTSQKIFAELFHWQPAVVEKAPIPGGNAMLYVLGVNSNGTIYQNIKQVLPA